MPDEEPVDTVEKSDADEKPTRKEDKRPGFTQEDKVAYKRLEMQYGGQEVEDTVRVVREEMNLSVDDTEVEVARRLKEKTMFDERKSAEKILETAQLERDALLREKATHAADEVKRKAADRLNDEMESDEKKE